MLKMEHEVHGMWADLIRTEVEKSNPLPTEKNPAAVVDRFDMVYSLQKNSVMRLDEESAG